MADKCPVCAAELRVLFHTSTFCPNEGAKRDHAEWRAEKLAKVQADIRAAQDLLARPRVWSYVGTAPGHNGVFPLDDSARLHSSAALAEYYKNLDDVARRWVDAMCGPPGDPNEESPGD